MPALVSRGAHRPAHTVIATHSVHHPRRGLFSAYGCCMFATGTLVYAVSVGSAGAGPASKATVAKVEKS